MAESPADALEFTYLHSVASGQVQVDIEPLLSNHVYKHDLNSEDCYGMTPLHWAARCKNIPVLEALLRAQVGVEAKDYAGRTALYYAALSGNRRCLELLLIAGSNIRARDRHGFQALHAAISLHGDKELLDIFLIGGVDVGARTNNGAFPLLFTSHYNCEKMAVALLETGAQIDAQDEDGDTALFAALCTNHPKMVEIMLSHGAKLDHHNKYGHTILHLLALWGTFEVITPFMSCQLRHIETDRKNKDGFTAWELFEARPEPPEGFKEAFEALLARCRAQRDSADTEVVELE